MILKMYKFYYHEIKDNGFLNPKEENVLIIARNRQEAIKLFFEKIEKNVGISKVKEFSE